MPTPQTSSTSSHLFIGAVIILIGVLLLLDNFYVLDAQDILRYWPALLIAFGLYKISTPPRSVFAGTIILVAGTLLLLDRLDVLYVRIWDLWPLLLILAGGSILLGHRRSQRTAADASFNDQASLSAGTAPGESTSAIGTPHTGHPLADGDSFITASAFLGSVNRVSTAQDFRGGSFTAVLGGCEVDLRRASIQRSPVTVNTFAMMGGVKIAVPTDWAVIVRGTPIMGGFDDKTLHPPAGTSEKQLIITGEAVMGGVEIVN